MHHPIDPSSAAAGAASSIRMAKRLARHAARLRLRTLPPLEATRRSAALCERLDGWEPVARAGAVLLFAPMAASRVPEVDLTAFAARCVARGRPLICVPRLEWDGGRLIPALVGDWEHDLVEGRHGVREPSADRPGFEPDEIDIVVVPGLAFDRWGGRLGRGGGFYDRFLGAGGLRARIVGTCFDRQLVESPLPREGHDVSVHAVVTESRVIATRENG